MPFDADAFIIPVNSTFHMTCTAFTDHEASAFTAKQFCGEQILVLCLVLGRGFLCLCHALLYSLEQFHAHDSRDSVRVHHIGVLILTDILTVMKHPCNAVNGDFSAPIGLNATQIHFIRNLLHGSALGIVLESISYYGSNNRIKLIVLAFIYRITDRQRTTVVFAFQRVFFHTTLYFFR